MTLLLSIMWFRSRGSTGGKEWQRPQHPGPLNAKKNYTVYIQSAPTISTTVHRLSDSPNYCFHKTLRWSLVFDIRINILHFSLLIHKIYSNLISCCCRLKYPACLHLGRSNRFILCRKGPEIRMIDWLGILYWSHYCQWPSWRNRFLDRAALQLVCRSPFVCIVEAACWLPKRVLRPLLPERLLGRLRCIFLKWSRSALVSNTLQQLE